MAMISEIKNIRLKLLRLFLSDQNLVDLISNETNHPIPAADLQYAQIFPFKYVFNTSNEEKVFLCFSLSAGPGQSSMTKKIAIRIYCFMHNSLMCMSNSIRQDDMFECIERLLNGNSSLGITDVEFSQYKDLDYLPKDYCGAYVEYYVKSINKDLC